MAPKSTLKAAPRKAARKTATKRNRRPPTELLAQLEQQREELATKFSERLSKLDARIEKIKNRYQKTIRLAEITSTHSADEIKQRLEEAKRQQRLLRMALKHKQ